MSAVRRLFMGLPISRKLTVLLWLFVLLVIGLLGLSYFTIENLSALRAYVGGEGLWSKAEKQATRDLSRYAVSHSEQDYENFRQALLVPQGDRKGRLELEKPHPDLNLVREGFLEGRLHPDDIDSQIRLFRNFRRSKHMGAAVEIWAQGDALIAELESLGTQLHSEMLSAKPDPHRIAQLEHEVDVIDGELTPLEDRFSSELGAAAREAKNMFLVITFFATAASLIAGLLFTFFLSRHVHQNEERYRHLVLSLYVVGVTLWLCYGLAIGAKALALANAASIGFAGTCLILKLLKEKNASASRERKRLRIAIDMDETIADSLKEQIRRYNDQFAESVTEADLAGRHLREFAPPERSEAVQRMVHDPEFFDRLDVIKDAQQVIGELAREHEVLIVSSAMEVPESFASKHRWLRRNFPFVAPANVIFCGNKGAIQADYLIDDEARHFANFRGIGLLFSASHNAGEVRFERMTSWEQVRRKFRDLEGVGARARINTRMRVHAPVLRASDVGGPMVPTFPTRENK